MIIDHIGIACKNINTAKLQYEELGYCVTQQLVYDPSRNLDYLFMANGNYTIELIGIHDATLKSDIDTILAQEKMVGNKMYHICYRTADMNSDIENFKILGYKLIKPPASAIACNNKMVAFMVNVDFGIIELLQI